MTPITDSRGSRARVFFALAPACMGGMCSHRDYCGHYHADDRRFVVERLCGKGEEVPTPVQVELIAESAA
jgi:hypothetical protein